jgi:hypothetical protein
MVVSNEMAKYTDVLFPEALIIGINPKYCMYKPYIPAKRTIGDSEGMIYKTLATSIGV